MAAGKQTPAVRAHQPARQRAAVSSGQAHNIISTADLQAPRDPRRDPIALAHAEHAELARAAGDRQGFWEARRAYLLRQAELLEGRA